jgi:hypothetical protein
MARKINTGLSTQQEIREDSRNKEIYLERDPEVGLQFKLRQAKRKWELHALS